MTSSQNTTSGPSRVRAPASFSAASMLALLLLSACSSVRPVEVHSAPIKVDLPTVRPLPDPAPIQTTPFKWTVTPEGDFSLTAKDYEALSKTMADISRWVDEAKWRLDYYRAQLVPRPAKAAQPAEVTN